MKLKEGYILREIAGTPVILPLRGVNLDGIITLNASGAFMWRMLEKGADVQALVDALFAEYEVSMEQAEEDVQRFLKLLLDFGCIEQ